MKKRVLAALITVLIPFAAGTMTTNVGDVNPLDDEGESRLYLIDKAARHLKDPNIFEDKVKEMARLLAIRPEWIMATIDSESDFNPRIYNRKGSGAKGLIQWMPRTLREFGISKLPEAPHLQLDYVYHYLNERQQTFGKFKSLTDVKLALLYPKAVGKPSSYALYSYPSKRYTQNQGLDMNQDGQVTVNDVRRWMKRDYPELYRWN